MKLYKTSKAAGIACVIFAVIFVAFGAIMLFNPDGEDLLVPAVIMFVFAALMLVVGIVPIVARTKTVELVDNKLVFNGFKYEPKNSVYLDETKKILTVPTSDIVDLQVQGQSKSSSFLAAFLGGAIGAAIAGNRNPDKLIVKTKDSQVVVYIPQVAGNKIKQSIKLEQEQEELEEKLDTIEPMKSLDEEE
ncbi:MAG: hypothetical protein NC310_04865 [Roseburia sp.]|nr:hypothetical protein [Anaeroplasma bactoclasticum]MCM1196391.1 hypothetical protein [Roseburia sp.]MCM1556157.1 hypothetical protein [Anaeroplasma bactoclasticum]